MKKIILTGPECSGKTSMAMYLSNVHDAPWVPEFARIYLAERNCNYEYRDLVTIGKGQLELENRFASFKPKILICDTSFLVLKIWSLHKYGKVDPWIVETLLKMKGCVWFLCKPDIAWESDPLRESETGREELFDKYVKELEDLGFNYFVLKGSFKERVESINQI